MKKRITLLIILSAFLTTFAMAQTGTVKGSIQDTEGNPLIGANVIIKGTTTGTITDIDGNFELANVPQGEQTLVASFIGYLSEEKVVQIGGGGAASASFRLIEDITALDELVVIGYGTVKKEDATGAVEAISSKDFNKGAITSAQDLVTGKIAGVQITSGGGAPGSGSTIRVRGGSSLNASNDPLIIIDGIPIDNNSVSGMRNPLNTINPNDIETFTVLKDASATAIYGSRASNGVILITTKSGAEGKMKIEYSGNVSINTVPKTVEVLSPSAFRNTIEANFPLKAGKMGDASTVWADEIFSTTLSTAHNISLSGKAGFLPYRASVGYDVNDGILNTSQMNRVTASLNLSPSFFDDHLKVKTNMKYMNLQNQFADEGAIGAAIAMDPTQTPYDETAYADYGGYFTWVNASGDPYTTAPKNPVAMLEQRTNTASVNRFIGNAQVEYKLHFLPDLKLNLNVGADYSFSEGSEIIDADAAWNSGAFNRGGFTNDYRQEKRNEVLDFFAKFNRELPSLNSNFDIMAGYSWQHFWSENESDSYYAIADTEGNYSAGYTLDRTENYLVSFFGRANYNLAQKYILTGTLRYDGSSRFVDENKWGLFPSAAFAWRMDQEDFLRNVGAISNLKLRLGVGVTGQQSITDSDYPAQGTYTLSNAENASYVYYYQDGTYTTSQMYRPDGYNAKLKWEETTTYNVGLDYGLYNDRFTGSLEVYSRYTDDLINTVTVPASANFKNTITSNVGTMKVQGLEFSLMTRVISTNDLVWKLGGNISVNQQEITKLTFTDDPDYIGVTLGNINGATGNTIKIHQVGQTPGSYYVYAQKYDANGMPIEGEYEDLNDNGYLDDGDLRIYKSPVPTATYGINTSVSYKNWDLALAGHGSIGNYMYNNVASNNAYTDKLASNVWLSNITSDIYNTNFQSNTVSRYLSDYYVQKAGFFRLDNITLGYNFEPLKFKDVRLRVYGTVNNVFVLTPYEGLDPEVYDGIDNDVYPRPRIFMLGVNMSF